MTKMEYLAGGNTVTVEQDRFEFTLYEFFQ